MYKIIENYFSHKDERGQIFGIINEGDWKEANFVQTNKGAKRGGHYHKITRELFYIIDGEIQVHLENIKTQKTVDFKLKKGDICIIEPYTNHLFEAINNSQWINMLSVKMDKEHPDIYIP